MSIVGLRLTDELDEIASRTKSIRTLVTITSDYTSLHLESDAPP